MTSVICQVLRLTMSSANKKYVAYNESLTDHLLYTSARKMIHGQSRDLCSFSNLLIKQAGVHYQERKPFNLYQICHRHQTLSSVPATKFTISYMKVYVFTSITQQKI
jgi:hypothetical protein